MKPQFQPDQVMHGIRALTLDLDNTLWDIDSVIHRAEATLWQWLGEHYPRTHDRWSADDLIGLRRDIMNEHRDRHFDLRFLRKKVLEEVAKSSGYDESLVEPAFEIFDHVRNDVELYPDVPEALEALYSRYTVVALTNGNSNLDKIGIRHLFHGVVTAVDAGAAKPDRQIFDVAVDEAGVRPEEILHVGDHPTADIDGARQAGMRTAWINRNAAVWPDELDHPDAVITTMVELRELLESAR